MLVYHFEGVPRNPVTVALKNILTLGIHTKVWLYRINREMDGHEGFHINLRWLAVMVALPIVTPIVVKFQTVRRLNKMVAHQVTVPILRSRYLGWASLVPVLGQAGYTWWVQGTLNKHWFWHRREERIRLAKERIKRIAAEPETEENLKRRFQCEEDVRTLEHEIQQEIEATRIRLGPERWENRTRYAQRLGSTGRMSRKELAMMRERDKKARKEARKRRAAQRGPLFGLLPRRTDPASDTRDPDKDADWEPETAVPPRGPDAIRELAESEGREPSEEEAAEIKAADKAIARREKELVQLAKQRERVRKAREKATLRAEKDEEKARAEKERKAARSAALAKKREEIEQKRAALADEDAPSGKRKKKAQSKSKRDPAPSKKEKAAAKKERAAGRKRGKRKRGKNHGDEARIPVKRRTYVAPAGVHESGEGPLRTLNITCPRCKSEIRGIRKRGDAPAKITCPSCKLVGKV